MIEMGLAAARWLQFAAALAAFGVPAFALYAMTPKTRTAEVVWLRQLMSGVVLTALIAAFLLLMAESAEMSGDASAALDPGTLWSVLSGTYFGAVWMVRLAALAGLAVVVRVSRPLALNWTAAIGLVVTASLAWQGHGGDGGVALGLAHQASDVVHLIAASVWIGALIGLVRLLSLAKTNAENAAAALHGLKRFSGIGAGVVAALVASGIVNTWALTTPRPLVEAISTPYALILSVKLALFALMLVLAAFNRFQFMPRLHRAIWQGGESEGAIKAARRSLALETILAALVLVAVSALGVMEPPNAS